MNSTETAFLFFYGLFWACALSSISPFRPFNTALIFNKETIRGISRLVVSVFFANILPVIGIWVFYKTPLPELHYDNGMGIVAMAILSMTLFSIPRFIHWSLFNRTTSRCLYSRKEIKLVVRSGKSPEPWYHHFFGGVLYIIVPLFIVWILSQSQSN